MSYLNTKDKKKFYDTAKAHMKLAEYHELEFFKNPKIFDDPKRHIQKATYHKLVLKNMMTQFKILDKYDKESLYERIVGL